jgi:altronate dehydratase large subunit
MELWGYRRPEGRVGVRNHVVVLAAVNCANVAVRRIAQAVPGAIALTHSSGCALLDYSQVLTTLVGAGRNPNVAAVLVVGLGCEQVAARSIVEGIAPSGKPVEALVIQEMGGETKTIEKGIRIASQWSQAAQRQVREPCSLADIVLASECGGSDATSGLAANPVMGWVADRVIAEGGAVVLSETMELMGAEHILARRSVTPEVAKALVEMVAAVERDIPDANPNSPCGQPAPGNIAGGISTIEEKSLGCVYKAGTTAVKGALHYSQTVPGAGLYVMDTPGQDLYSVTGMVCGGAQLVVFSTGRGTPLGCALAPVIKVTGNARTAIAMAEHIDLSVAPVIDGSGTIESLGAQLFQMLVAIANGELTASERLGHQDFAPYEGKGPVL